MADSKVQITIEVDGVKKVVNSVKDAEKAMEGLGKETKKTTEEGTALGMLKSKFSGIIGPLKGVVAGMKTLKGAIISTGVGALVVALGSLVAYFTTSEEGSKKLAVATEALGIIWGKLTETAADLGKRLVEIFTNPKQALTDFGDSIKTFVVDKFNALLDTLGLVGKSIKLLFEGEFSAAAATAGEAFTKLNEEFNPVVIGTKALIAGGKELARVYREEIVPAVNEAVATAEKLVTQQRALRDQNQALVVANAELNKELETQQKIGEDTTRGYEERRAALEAAGEAQVKLSENVAKLAKNEEALLKLQISQESSYEKREELETQLAEATAARIDAETALEIKKIDVAKITTELDLEEVERKAQINELLRELDDEKIMNLWDKAARELEVSRDQQLKELEDLKATEEEKQKVKEAYTAKVKKLDIEKDKFDKKLLKDKREAQIGMAKSTFEGIASLLGENSAAGKSSAVAAALINTYQGITAELSTKTVTPFEIGLKIANVATIAGIGFKSVKDIISTPVPGGKGGGGGRGGGSMSIPSAPAVNPLEALNAGAADEGETEVGLGQQTGSAGANVVRAYVVSEEMSTQQEADAKINDLARL